METKQIKIMLLSASLGLSLLFSTNISFANTEQDDVMARMEQSNRDFDKRSEEIRRSFDQTIDSYSNGTVANSKLAEKQKAEIDRQFNQSKNGLSGGQDLTRGLDTNINNTDRDLMRLQNNASNSSLYSDAELDTHDRYSDISGGAQIDNGERFVRGNRNREAATLVMGDSDTDDRDYAKDEDVRARGVGEIVTDRDTKDSSVESILDNDLLKYLLVVIVVFVVMAILFFNAKRKDED